MISYDRSDTHTRPDNTASCTSAESSILKQPPKHKSENLNPVTLEPMTLIPLMQAQEILKVTAAKDRTHRCAPGKQTTEVACPCPLSATPFLSCSLQLPPSKPRGHRELQSLKEPTKRISTVALLNSSELCCLLKNTPQLRSNRSRASQPQVR